ncbi:tRNA pseudouridine(13) synthase TruD [Rodentibacter caecimuris]|uniref:tRNA pseudouridine synthase D n=1 Tax=Rodentibacter caecimuris TaxID=1796644 RepID=A0ABX3KY39_9PAST|nr:tRNA pseudouridine(13) synthase TruD [Rodentibacter heylii]
MQNLAYLTLKTAPKATALLKARHEDFLVTEELGYEMSGDGEFVAVKVRKTDCNTLFVGEQLANFAGISGKNMSYAGLKDRKAVTTQWFSLQMPGKLTPDFSQFQFDGIEILEVTRHNRKIRIGSLQGNYFELLLRDVLETDELNTRLTLVQQNGFPNYFMEQRFGHNGNNLAQAECWAKGEINIKDRKKRRFYLSAARSDIFNKIVSARLEQDIANQVLPGDIIQLSGSNSRFNAQESELTQLQTRLAQQDILLTAPLIGENNLLASEFENKLLQEHQIFNDLMKQTKMKADRRPILVKPQHFTWQFNQEGLRLAFYLPAGSYATAMVREIVKIKEQI